MNLTHARILAARYRRELGERWPRVASTVAEVLERHARPSHWSGLAARCGLPPPDEETTRAAIDLLRPRSDP